MNRPVSPLLAEASSLSDSLAPLHAGMRVQLLGPATARGFVPVRSENMQGYMRADELLRRFLPEDAYPGPKDSPDRAFLTSDRDGDGVPDFRDIVHAARSMIGLPFDDAANLRLQDAGGSADGRRWWWRADGKDNNGNGETDERDEDVVVCVDLLNRALDQAGYPVERMMRQEHPGESSGAPGGGDPYFTRRVRNLLAHIRGSPEFEYFREPRIASRDAAPGEPARPGDLLFFGLRRDLGTFRFAIKHSGICVSVDPETGLPGWIITGIVPRARFFDLRRGYDRFIYCGHARLRPAGEPRSKRGT